jgi:hypothetical protein
VTDGRCQLTDLPPAMCAHCRQPAPARRAPRPSSRYGPWFPAGYRGRCADCDSGLDPGDRIRANGHGGYLCQHCGDDDQEDDDVNSQTALSELIAGLGPLAPEPTVTSAPPTPAGPPCLDPWCASGRTPCGHTPDAHMAHHGAAAVIAGQPTTTRGTAGAATTRPDHAPAAAPSGPPPSTVAEMRDVLTNLDASRPRSQQTRLGPSELGTPCQRQLAMKLAGVPRQLPDLRPPWAPMQGTAMHVLMEEALRFHNAQLGRPRWVIEERVHMDDEINGSGDALDTDHATVVDWKYVGVTTLAKVKRKTIPNEQLVRPDYRVQAHLYGYGHERAGRQVRWVRLVFLARSHDYDASAEWTERYQPDIAIAALDRYYATQDLIAQLGVADNPAMWAAVPAAVSDDTCAWCPFRRKGGPADGTGCPGNTQARIAKQTEGLIA